MNVQGLAVGIVIDAAEGEILQFEPDLVRRRDQAAGPPTVEKCQTASIAAGKATASSNGRRRGHHVAVHDVLRAATRYPRYGTRAWYDQVGFTASTKLVSMKVAKSGRRLICFSASMWSA